MVTRGEGSGEGRLEISLSIMTWTTRCIEMLNIEIETLSYTTPQKNVKKLKEM